MRNVIVAEQHGEWNEGASIFADATIIKYFRSLMLMVATANEGMTVPTLSDADLLAIVDSVQGGNPMDVLAERMGKLMAGVVPVAGATPQPAPQVQGELAPLATREQGSKALAEKAWANVTFQTTLSGLVETWEKTKLASRIMRDALIAAIGREGMDSMPRIGTTIDGRTVKRDGVDVPTVQANNYDLYWVDGYGARGKAVKVKHSYVEDFAKSLPAWATLQTAIDNLDVKGDEHGSSRTRRNLTYRQGVVVKLVKDGIALDQQLADIDGYKNVKWKWDDADNGVACFMLQNAEDTTKLGHWTLSEMMQLDVGLARAPQKKVGVVPGSYTALVETTTREPKTPVGEQITPVVGKNFYPSILEMDKFLMGSDNFVWAQGEARAKLPNGDLKPEAIALITALEKLSQMITAITHQNADTAAVVTAMGKREKEETTARAEAAIKAA